MKSYGCWFIALLTCAVSSWAHAVSCESGLLSTIGNGSTCSIGDKTFTFQSFEGTGIAAADILFTPDASDPLSPGFTLSTLGPLTITATNSNVNIQAFLNYTLDVTSGANSLVGSTVQLNNADVSISNSTSLAVVDAFNQMLAGAILVFPEVCISTGSPGTGCTVGPPFPSSVSDTRNFLSPVNALTAGSQLGFNLIVSGTGSATFVSADYTFNQTAIPEPASITLTSLGALALLGVWRRRQRN